MRYPSAPLVPENDPTTLFTVAGMSQFKDMFLGRGTQPFTRATTAQKCLRTNDIANVGRTARHQTFFEMLGNFSFNDYPKREAIVWAWSYLTSDSGPGPRLSVSVNKQDEDAQRIWQEETGMPERRIFRLGDGDNFWPANALTEGPEGPGEFCSEIFWDFRNNDDANDNLTSSTGRFVEIWNLVFPQFNVRKPNADGTPNLEQLGRRNIYTGMGLERISCVVQGVYNNFDTDSLQSIVQRVSELSSQPYVPNASPGPQGRSQCAHPPHRRPCPCGQPRITDGALPGNTGRGHIVRRLTRRATLDSERLGVEEARLHQVVDAVVASMQAAYPEVARRQDLARDDAEGRGGGLPAHPRARPRARTALARQGGGVFSGDDAFDLVTTHGFPRRWIEDLIADKGPQDF